MSVEAEGYKTQTKKIKYPEQESFSFEDLYYDYYNQIDDVVVIGAVITFEDNSKISVTSEQAVQKLYYDNHDVSLPENFWDLVQ